MNSVVSSADAPLRLMSSLNVPLRRALGGGAVVADDVVDERVVEDAELVEGVDEPADVVVGVLQEAGVDLHLAGEHRLRGRPRISSQAGISSGRSVSSASAGMTPSAFWRANVSLRSSSQPSSNAPLYLSDHSVGTWCGACVAPGAKYMKNGLSGISAFCWRTQSMAWSVMSSVKW